MGGGPKKPAMSNEERDFDIVFIGKYLSHLFNKTFNYRRRKCHSHY
jgi:hypothetical protein